MTTIRSQQSPINFGETKNETLTAGEAAASSRNEADRQLLLDAGVPEEKIRELEEARAKSAAKKLKEKINLHELIAEHKEELMKLVPGKTLWPANLIAKVMEQKGWYRAVSAANYYGVALGGKRLALPKARVTRAYHLPSIGGSPEEKSRVQQQLDDAFSDTIKMLTVTPADLGFDEGASENA